MVGCLVGIERFEEMWREIPHLMCEHVLLEIPLRRKAPVACRADERSLLGMASVVDVQGTLTGEVLPTYIAVSVLQDPLFSQIVDQIWRILGVVK